MLLFRRFSQVLLFFVFRQSSSSGACTRLVGRRPPSQAWEEGFMKCPIAQRQVTEDRPQCKQHICSQTVGKCSFLVVMKGELNLAMTHPSCEASTGWVCGWKMRNAAHVWAPNYDCIAILQCPLVSPCCKRFFPEFATQTSLHTQQPFCLKEVRCRFVFLMLSKVRLRKANLPASFHKGK